MGKTYCHQDNKTFVNPYHFVPLDGGCPRWMNYEKLAGQNGLKTGWIECEMTTKTPIFIPNTTNGSFFEAETDEERACGIKSYDFYSYQDNCEPGQVPTQNPVIPGSSIRGPIRTAFEVLTNSCMSTIDDNYVLYKRVTTPAKPGRLIKEDGQWMLVECDKYGVALRRAGNDPNNFFDTIAEWKDGALVHFTVGGWFETKGHKIFQYVNKISDNKFSGSQSGYLHKGERFGRRKHHESVFVENGTRHKLTERNVENLLENYKLYQDDTVNLSKKKGEHDGYSSNISRAENKNIKALNGALVYFKQHRGKYYLCPAAIGREVFHNRLHELLGEGDDSYSPCTDHAKLCPTCHLFGFAGKESKAGDDKKRNALASRIRFSDAVTEKPKFLEPVILPELAGPKPSATEMYLKKPDGGKKKVAMWNYDYAYALEDKKTGKGRETIDLGKYQPEIQGRKFYWHHKEMKTFAKENDRFPVGGKIEYSERLVKVRPVDEGVKFRFKVHFNRLSKDELNKLLWVLTLGNNENLGHKMGMGKPVGLGSVRIEVADIFERRLEIVDGGLKYEIHKYDSQERVDFVKIDLGCSTETMLAFEKMANFKFCPKNIAYPYCIDSNGKAIPENFNWFVGNKQIEDSPGTGTNPVISENLPPLLSDDEIKQKKVIFNKYPELSVIVKTSSKTYNPSQSYAPQPENRKLERKPEPKEERKIDKIVAAMKKAKTKEVKKYLSQLKAEKPSENDLKMIETILNKRADAKQKKTNPMVKANFQLLQELKNNNG